MAARKAATLGPEELRLRRAVRAHPEDPVPRNRLGDWLVAQGLLEPGLKAFREAAERYLLRQQPVRAMAVLKKAFRLAPDDHVLADQLVQACRQAGRPQAAAEVYFSLSLRLGSTGDQERAYQLFARGVAENPSNLQRKHRLAVWSRTLGRRDRAADLYLELASAWGQKRNLDRATKFLQKARSLRNGPKAVLVEARLLTLSGQHPEAVQLARHALVRFPNHEGLQTWLAASEAAGPEPAGLVAELPSRAVLSRLRQNLYQAQNWLTQGYPARAMALVQRMLFLDPGFPPALDMAEQIHRDSGYPSRFQALCIACSQRLSEQGRSAEALACLDRVEALFPGSTAAYRHALEAAARRASGRA